MSSRTRMDNDNKKPGLDDWLDAHFVSNFVYHPTTTRFSIRTTFLVCSNTQDNAWTLLSKSVREDAATQINNHGHNQPNRHHSSSQ
mmetsp:Transcript_7564/g.20992  ORF Transcript_7564/g.20992 Transcript_7564/m.20992 type:complete len:86 (+) Transcript_7564:1217-1474(+)